MHYVVETTKVRHHGPQFVQRTSIVSDRIISRHGDPSDAEQAKAKHPGTRVREVWSDADYDDAVAHERNRGA